MSLDVENQGNSDTGAGRTYRVKLAAAHPASDDYAKSAAATIGTLVTAVAGFYFGQRATTSVLSKVQGDGSKT